MKWIPCFDFEEHRRTVFSVVELLTTSRLALNAGLIGSPLAGPGFVRRALFIERRQDLSGKHIYVSSFPFPFPFPLLILAEQISNTTTVFNNSNQVQSHPSIFCNPSLIPIAYFQHEVHHHYHLCHPRVRPSPNFYLNIKIKNPSILTSSLSSLAAQRPSSFAIPHSNSPR